jgi:hypothetical protein
MASAAAPSMFSKVLAADIAGSQFQKVHEYAGIALGGASHA